jgi:hypothetical protein
MKNPENKVLFWLKTSWLPGSKGSANHKVQQKDAFYILIDYTRLINPLRMAYNAAWVRLVRPSLSNSELTYLATVFS